MSKAREEKWARERRRQCLRNWRWWAVLPVQVVLVYGWKACDAASIALQRAHASVWRWVDGGAG